MNEIEQTVAEEREACALECDKEADYARLRMKEPISPRCNEDYIRGLHEGQKQAALWCAKHIRERTVKK